MSNLRGQQRDKPFRDALRMEIAAAGADHKELRVIARKLLERAREGAMDAIREVADRMDGKVAQSVIHEEGASYVARLPLIVKDLADWRTTYVPLPAPSADIIDVESTPVASESDTTKPE